MKGYLINSFTPFVSSELDSRFVRTGNRILNVTYSVVAIVSILALSISDPFNFGHIPTAAAVFLILGFLGVRIQKAREDDFEVEEEYETVINNFVIIQQKLSVNFNNINIDINSEIHNNSSTPQEENEAELLLSAERKDANKRGRKKLEDGETPFCDSEYELFFRRFMGTVRDYTLKGVDVKAIARLLSMEKMNKGEHATKSRASIPTIVEWILKNYPSKIEPDLKPITMKKAKPDDSCLKKWKDNLNRP